MPSARARRRRTGLLLCEAALAGGLGTVDARFAIRGSEPHRTAGVVIVGIDERTFNYFRDRRLPSQWPFPRRYHARVIDRFPVVFRSPALRRR